MDDRHTTKDIYRVGTRKGNIILCDNGLKKALTRYKGGVVSGANEGEKDRGLTMTTTSKKKK